MLKKFKEDKSFMILLFLGIFSFAYGLFNNYRVLWLDSNGFNAITISKIITFASIVTALSLLFFSLKVSTKKLRKGVLVSLILEILTSIGLALLNGTEHYFWIKFLTFFNIAFVQLIFSSVYPLIMNLTKGDLVYTRRDVVESISDKLGFFFVSFLLGITIGNFVFDYNTCLIISIIFTIISFIVLLLTKVEGKEETSVTIKETIKYLNKKKSVYLYLVMNFLASAAWAVIVGLKMLTFTDIIGLSTKGASYLILALGIVTNILAMLIVKKFKFKNDYINVFLKYGSRVILYFLMFITGNPIILLITMIYLLLTDMTYNFVIGGYFSNNMEEKYVLMFSVMKYIVSLFGDGLGVLICGITFNNIKYVGLASFLLGLAVYILANILVYIKRHNSVTKN